MNDSPEGVTKNCSGCSSLSGSGTTAYITGTKPKTNPNTNPIQLFYAFSSTVP